MVPLPYPPVNKVIAVGQSNPTSAALNALQHPELPRLQVAPDAGTQPNHSCHTSAGLEQQITC